MLFRRIRNDVVPNAEVECETLRNLPVVLREDANLVVPRSEEAGLRADTVVINETSQQLRRFISREIAIANVEVALARNRTEEGDVSSNRIAAKLQGVTTAGIGHR